MMCDEPCPKELSRQSEHSPSLVKDEEDVLRLIFNPTHLDSKTGEISNAAFSKTELEENRLSVTRKECGSRDSVRQNITKIEKGGQKPKTLEKILSVKCCDIRAIDEETKMRAFCVIDDGTEENPAHAHIGFAATPQNVSVAPNWKTSARGNLLRLFREKAFATVEEVFS